jgi:multiple sugar transport system substrate-binding protein
MKKIFRGNHQIGQKAIILFSLFLLTACTSFPYSSDTPATPTTPEAESEGIEITPTPESEALVIEEGDTPKTLRIWLPPQFDPDTETEASALLRVRLEEFQKRRPDLILETRIKAIEGEASLLNALIATHQAAPSAMPDLVALSRPDLESAVNEGILHPLDGLTMLLDDPDWFPYARPLSNIQNSTYGLPFAANLLGLRYLPSEEFPFFSVENLPEQEAQILLPEDVAELSFCLYNEVELEEESLTNLLSFYQSDIFSQLAQEKTFEIHWAKEFLDEIPADAILSPIPTPEGGTCSLASAWLWTLAGSDPDLQPAAVELAEFLSQSEFLAEWTTETGYLAPRPTALTDIAFQELSLVAVPIPSNERVEALAEIFNAATISVLTDHVDPRAAAQEILENLQ